MWALKCTQQFITLCRKRPAPRSVAYSWRSWGRSSRYRRSSSWCASWRRRPATRYWWWWSRRTPLTSRGTAARRRADDEWGAAPWWDRRTPARWRLQCCCETCWAGHLKRNRMRLLQPQLFAPCRCTGPSRFNGTPLLTITREWFSHQSQHILLHVIVLFTDNLKLKYLLLI